jgi:taurine dioxygenase
LLTRPLHADFGVEVLELDPERISAQDAEGLKALLDEHQLLLFRGGKPLTPEAQVALCSLFGPPVDDGNGKKWSVLHNDDAAGRIKLPFHADFTYTASPIKVISLHATDVPPGGTSTSFVSGIHGWESLPGELQQRLSPMSVRHRHRSAIAADSPEFIAVHPLRKLHPRSGRPILFATEHHAQRILELDPAESDAVLTRLFEHLYEEERIYTHRWALHDLVVWDNLAVQHARREAADPSAGTRVVQRVVVNDATYPELLERARREEAERRHAA